MAGGTGDVVVVPNVASGRRIRRWRLRHVWRRGNHRSIGQQRGQRAVQRLGHRDSSLVCGDHALELRNATTLRPQIQRLDVDQRSADRQHEQLPAQDLETRAGPRA